MEVSSKLQQPLQDGNPTEPDSPRKEENNLNAMSDDEEGWMEVRSKKNESRPFSNKINHADNGSYFNDRPKKHSRPYRSHPEMDKSEHKYRDEIGINNGTESSDSPGEAAMNSDGDSDEKTAADSDKKNKVEYVAAPIPKTNAWGASEQQTVEEVPKKTEKPVEATITSKPKNKEKTIAKQVNLAVESHSETNHKSSENWSDLVPEEHEIISDLTNGKIAKFNYLYQLLLPIKVLAQIFDCLSCKNLFDRKYVLRNCLWTAIHMIWQ